MLKAGLMLLTILGLIGLTEFKDRIKIFLRIILYICSSIYKDHIIVLMKKRLYLLVESLFHFHVM